MSQSLRILIVEDEQETGHAVKRFLEFRGHQVDLANDESSATQLAEETVPEVLVCDWKLANNDDGVEVAQRIQAQQEVPVILVTGHRLAQARQKARETEVEIAAYRRKPVSLDELAALIESLGDAD